MKVSRFIPLSLLWLASLSAAQDKPLPHFKKEMIQRLRDPAQRVAAIVEMEERMAEEKWTKAKRRAAPFGIRHPRLSLCPVREPNKPPLYMVSYQNDWEAGRHALDLIQGKPAEDKDAYPELPLAIDWRNAVPKVTLIKDEKDGLSPPPGGRLQDCSRIFLTAEGQAVALPEAGFTSDGWGGDFDHDGILDSAETTNWGNPAEGSVGATQIRAFHIRSMERVPRTPLYLIYNWKPGPERWAAEMADTDGDGTLEVCLGPVVDDKGQTEGDTVRSWEVIYRWDGTQKKWQGPDGARDDHFLRYPGEEKGFWAWLTELSKAGGLTNKSPAPRDPRRPGKPKPAPADPDPETAALSADAKILRFYLGNSGGTSYHGDGFRLPPAVWNLTPKEAALTLANANRTGAHRGQFEILTIPSAQEPPVAGTMQLFQNNSWITSYCSLLETGGGVGRWSVMDEGGPSFTAALKEDEARWLFQTLWWLDQVRTRAFDPFRVTQSNAFSGADDVARFTVVLTPEKGKPGVLLEDRVLQPVGPGWRDHYTRAIAHRLAVELADAWSDRHQFPAREERKVDPGFILEQLRRLTPGGKPKMPLLWAAAVIGASDNAPPADAAVELERLRKTWKVSGKQARDLQIAIRKAALARDPARLKAMAASKKKEDEDLSAWAQQRLDGEQDEKTEKDLQTGAPANPTENDANEKVPMMIRAGRVEEALTWFRALPGEERITRLVWFLDLLPVAQRRDKTWRAELITALSAPHGEKRPAWMADAVRYLVPPDQPMLHEGADIDALLIRLIETAPQAAPAPLAPWTGGAIEAACAAALTRRAGDASRVDIVARCAVYDYFRDHSAKGTLNAAEAALAHLAAKFPAAAAEKLTDIINARLKNTKGRDAAIAMLAWTGGLRAMAPLLQDQATSGPDKEESHFAENWGGSRWTGGPAVPGPTHAARRVLGIWQEKDAAVKARALICLAALQEFREEAGGLYGPASRLREEFLAALGALAEPERASLATFAENLPELEPDIALESGASLPAARDWTRQAMSRP